jgi:heme-degrading monooxygenase HmoA
MFARMTIMPIKLDRIDEAIRLYKKSVIPEAKRQAGFLGTCLLTDRQAGKGIAVTFWKDEKTALANEESRYYQEQLVKFISLFAGPPIREGYEVSVHCFETQAAPKSRRKTPKKTAPEKKRTTLAS